MDFTQLAPGGSYFFYMVVTVGAMVVGQIVSSMLQRRFKEYSMRPINLSGAEVALKMLRDNGIHNVQVISTPGQLTDHYNPADRTVNLSDVVYHERNVAAAAVAAHECGHAIQHAKAYPALQFRSAMVPMVSFASKFVNFILIAGLVLAGMGHPMILLVGVILFACTTLFSVVTLPVEFDASKRALVWLDQSRVMGNLDHDKAKNALFWAAMTYVVAALASIGQLLYFIMQLLAAQRQND